MKWFRRRPKCVWVAGMDPANGWRDLEIMVWMCATHRCLGNEPTKRCAVAERKS